jgi:predicted membrane channel-forming protein YqfA (hemolysin III family)
MSAFLYIPEGAIMSVSEKRAWIMALVTMVAYAIYLAIVVGRAGSGTLAHVPYAWTLVWSVVGAIVASILLDILSSFFAPRSAAEKDQRDREINRLGDYIGQSFLIVGAVTALVLALIEAAPFWIANTIYLGFVLSAIVGSVAKIIAYRRGFQTW